MSDERSERREETYGRKTKSGHITQTNSREEVREKRDAIQLSEIHKPAEEEGIQTLGDPCT